ncbi:MAG: MFS transporter, partial [Lacunisphaera sp.]
GLLFYRTERLRVDTRSAVQALVGPDQSAKIIFNADTARALLGSSGEAGRGIAGHPLTLSVIYSYGGFRATTAIARSDDAAATPLEISREATLPANAVSAFFSNPFASLKEARTAPLKIENAIITPVPSTSNGWLTAFFTFCFMAFFAVGPGVCVWLALSELMPTRIRSNGMSIALTLNQAVSTTIAAVFLPTVGKYGYSTMFFVFAGCTVVYFITAAFFLPETKGKTLEEIEAAFEPGNRSGTQSGRPR